MSACRAYKVESISLPPEKPTAHMNVLARR
jgi:hypothetical protein